MKSREWRRRNVDDDDEFADPNSSGSVSVVRNNKNNLDSDDEEYGGEEGRGGGEEQQQQQHCGGSSSSKQFESLEAFMPPPPSFLRNKEEEESTEELSHHLQPSSLASRHHHSLPYYIAAREPNGGTNRARFQKEEEDYDDDDDRYYNDEDRDYYYKDQFDYEEKNGRILPTSGPLPPYYFEERNASLQQCEGSSNDSLPVGFQVPESKLCVFQGELERMKGKYRKRWTREAFLFQHNLLLTCTSTKPLQIKNCIALSSLSNLQRCGSRKEPYRFRLFYTTIDVSSRHNKNSTKLVSMLLKADDEEDLQRWLDVFNQQISLWKGRSASLIDFVERPSVATKLRTAHRTLKCAGLMQLTSRLFNVLREKRHLFMDEAFKQMRVFTAYSAAHVETLRAKNVVESTRLASQRDAAFTILERMYHGRLHYYWNNFQLSCQTKHIVQTQQYAGSLLAEILVEDQSEHARQVVYWRKFHLRTTFVRIYFRILREAFESLKVKSTVIGVEERLKKTAIQKLLHRKYHYNHIASSQAFADWRRQTLRRRNQQMAIQMLMKKNKDRKLKSAISRWTLLCLSIDRTLSMAGGRLYGALAKVFVKELSWAWRCWAQWTSAMGNMMTFSICANMNEVNNSLVSAYNIVPIHRGLHLIAVLISGGLRKRMASVWTLWRQRFYFYRHGVKTLQTSVQVMWGAVKIRLIFGMNALKIHCMEAGIRRRRMGERKLPACALMFSIHRILSDSWRKLRAVRQECIARVDPNLFEVGKMSVWHKFVEQLSEKFSRHERRMAFSAILQMQKNATQGLLMRSLLRFNLLQRVVALADRLRMTVQLRAFQRLQFFRREKYSKLGPVLTSSSLPSRSTLLIPSTAATAAAPSNVESQPSFHIVSDDNNSSHRASDYFLSRRPPLLRSVSVSSSSLSSQLDKSKGIGILSGSNKKINRHHFLSSPSTTTTTTKNRSSVTSHPTNVKVASKSVKSTKKRKGSKAAAVTGVEASSLSTLEVVMMCKADGIAAESEPLTSITFDSPKEAKRLLFEEGEVLAVDVTPVIAPYTNDIYNHSLSLSSSQRYDVDVASPSSTPSAVVSASGSSSSSGAAERCCCVPLPPSPPLTAAAAAAAIFDNSSAIRDDEVSRKEGHPQRPFTISEQQLSNASVSCATTTTTTNETAATVILPLSSATGNLENSKSSSVSSNSPVSIPFLSCNHSAPLRREENILIEMTSDDTSSLSRRSSRKSGGGGSSGAAKAQGMLSSFAATNVTANSGGGGGGGLVRRNSIASSLTSAYASSPSFSAAPDVLSRSSRSLTSTYSKATTPSSLKVGERSKRSSVSSSSSTVTSKVNKSRNSKNTTNMKMTSQQFPQQHSMVATTAAPSLPSYPSSPERRNCGGHRSGSGENDVVAAASSQQQPRLLSPSASSPPQPPSTNYLGCHRRSIQKQQKFRRRHTSSSLDNVEAATGAAASTGSSQTTTSPRGDSTTTTAAALRLRQQQQRKERGGRGGGVGDTEGDAAVDETTKTTLQPIFLDPRRIGDEEEEFGENRWWSISDTGGGDLSPPSPPPPPSSDIIATSRNVWEDERIRLRHFEEEKEENGYISSSDKPTHLSSSSLSSHSDNRFESPVGPLMAFNQFDGSFDLDGTIAKLIEIRKKYRQKTSSSSIPSSPSSRPPKPWKSRRDDDSPVRYPHPSLSSHFNSHPQSHFASHHSKSSQCAVKEKGEEKDDRNFYVSRRRRCHQTFTDPLPIHTFTNDAAAPHPPCSSFFNRRHRRQNPSMIIDSSMESLTSFPQERKGQTPPLSRWAEEDDDYNINQKERQGMDVKFRRTKLPLSAHKFLSQSSSPASLEEFSREYFSKSNNRSRCQQKQIDAAGRRWRGGEDEYYEGVGEGEGEEGSRTQLPFRRGRKREQLEGGRGGDGGDDCRRSEICQKEKKSSFPLRASFSPVSSIDDIKYFESRVREEDERSLLSGWGEKKKIHSSSQDGLKNNNTPYSTILSNYMMEADDEIVDSVGTSDVIETEDMNALMKNLSIYHERFPFNSSSNSLRGVLPYPEQKGRQFSPQLSSYSSVESSLSDLIFYSQQSVPLPPSSYTSALSRSPFSSNSRSSFLLPSRLSPLNSPSLPTSICRSPSSSISSSSHSSRSVTPPPRPSYYVTPPPPPSSPVAYQYEFYQRSSSRPDVLSSSPKRTSSSSSLSSFTSLCAASYSSQSSSSSSLSAAPISSAPLLRTTSTATPLSRTSSIIKAYLSVPVCVPKQNRRISSREAQQQQQQRAAVPPPPKPSTKTMPPPSYAYAYAAMAPGGGTGDLPRAHFSLHHLQQQLSSSSSVSSFSSSHSSDSSSSSPYHHHHHHCHLTKSSSPISSDLMAVETKDYGDGCISPPPTTSMKISMDNNNNSHSIRRSGSIAGSPPRYAMDVS